jgi:hypothetical protein
MWLRTGKRASACSVRLKSSDMAGEKEDQYLVVVAGRRWPPVAGYRCPLVEDQYLGVSRGAVCARKRKERCTWLSGPCWLLPPVAAAVASTREG